MKRNKKLIRYKKDVRRNGTHYWQKQIWKRLFCPIRGLRKKNVDVVQPVVPNKSENDVGIVGADVKWPWVFHIGDSDVDGPSDQCNRCFAPESSQ